MIEVGEDLAIRVSRGDSARIVFELEGDLPKESAALFTARRESGEAVIERFLTVKDGEAALELTAEDTDIPPGGYLWDLRVRLGSGLITPHAPAWMIVLEVVGDAKRALAGDG